MILCRGFPTSNVQGSIGSNKLTYNTGGGNDELQFKFPPPGQGATRFRDHLSNAM